MRSNERTQKTKQICPLDGLLTLSTLQRVGQLLVLAYFIFSAVLGYDFGKWYWHKKNHVISRRSAGYLCNHHHHSLLRHRQHTIKHIQATQ